MPSGFATTADAYWHFIDHNDLRQTLSDDMAKLKDDRSNLSKVGDAVRGHILGGDMPGPVAEAIRQAYRDLAARLEREDPDVAVRSSSHRRGIFPRRALQVSSRPSSTFAAKRRCWIPSSAAFASLFTDRAIAYREENGFDHMSIALSAGVQQMARSDLAGSGVMFSIDTETGFPAFGPHHRRPPVSAKQ